MTSCVTTYQKHEMFYHRLQENQALRGEKMQAALDALMEDDDFDEDMMISEEVTTSNNMTASTQKQGERSSNSRRSTSPTLSRDHMSTLPKSSKGQRSISPIASTSKEDQSQIIPDQSIAKVRIITEPRLSEDLCYHADPQGNRIFGYVNKLYRSSYPEYLHI